MTWNSRSQFKRLLAHPIEFPLYVSRTRLTDLPGELITVDRQHITALPPIRTVLRTNKQNGIGRSASEPQGPTDGNRHSRPVVQRSRRTTRLAAPIRRALDDTHRPCCA